MLNIYKGYTFSKSDRACSVRHLSQLARASFLTFLSWALASGGVLLSKARQSRNQHAARRGALLPRRLLNRELEGFYALPNVFQIHLVMRLIGN